AAVGTDVYGLGAILYEMLTGRPPFLGAAAVETLLQVVGEEPIPPRRFRPELPPNLETICLKCLEKKRQRRYATAEDLAEDLGRFLNGTPVKARPVPAWERAGRWARKHPAATALGGVSVLAAMALAGVVVSLVHPGRTEGTPGQPDPFATARKADEALRRRHLYTDNINQ